ncbi:alpha/beta hydrolase fold domain-containing protein [Mycobacterium sp. ACS4331]|uniref:flavin-containing monooxygenase n=1 Tax=Mycobacterium sp. ACS4331 TaxID=1834121 RepID=UPI0008004B00|nr:alpha/beta hydrolase fold domain-containing protein [Mycobacterium sp. ACS4331]OBF29693.1 hypothetical protein A5727_23800 [Mycobacterium sp. ACS4331]
MGTNLTSTSASSHHDVIVIGAGFAGMYAIHKFRDQLGLDVRGFEAAPDVGGTWYWNRYPGARVDIAGVYYSFSFDEQLQQEWHWTERYPAQAEILRYIEHVADRYDIRRSITFNARVTSVTWDDGADLWRVTTDAGTTHTARFFVAGSGTLSSPKKPDIPGVDSFAGQTLMTSSWPDGVDLQGKRVGVIGTGASGVQVISEVSKIAGSLTVFQRTPNFVTPMRNHPIDPVEEAAEKARYAEIREESRNNFFGMPYHDILPSALAASEQERRAVYGDRWQKGGFRFLMDTFADLLINREANDTAAEYIREQIRERVKDPVTAELLCPKDEPYGTKRPPLETDYLDAYNRETVTLVDISSNSIDSVIPSGVRLADGTIHELDVLILAVGFDALTGPLMAMNITGRNGQRLADAWKDGPETYLGLMSRGFPNLFMITGPQSPAVTYTVPLAIEDHVDFAADLLRHMDAHGQRVFDVELQAQQQWDVETNAMGAMTLMVESKSSWYMGANVPGKPRKILLYIGGVPRYRGICDNVVHNDFRGLRFAATSSELTDAVGAPALDPAFMFLDEMTAKQGVTGLKELGVEGARAVVSSFLEMQAPPRAGVEVAEQAYGDDPEQRLRVYTPEGSGPGAPVVVYFHGGGFVGGDLAIADEPARDLATRTGAIVVSATYRRAPEHRFPAAHNDAYAALRWTVDNIGAHGGDPTRIALAGDSAGGNLAVAAALRAKADGIDLESLLLIYPLVNLSIETPSRAEFAGGPVITRADLDWFAEQYAPAPEDRTDPRLALDTADLEGLPPTLILANECDPLRDEAILLADRMRATGVDVSVRRFDGMGHGGFWLSLAVPRCEEQRAAAAEFLTSNVTAPSLSK